jgi:hypothetical protein
MDFWSKFSLVPRGGSRPSLLDMWATIWPIVPVPNDDDDGDGDDDCGAVGGMMWKENQSIQRKPATVPLCPTQIPHDLTQARTQAAAKGSRGLAAWTMGRPIDVTLEVMPDHASWVVSGSN